MKKTMMFLLCAHILANNSVMLALSADQQPPAQSKWSRLINTTRYVAYVVVSRTVKEIDTVLHGLSNLNKYNLDKQRQEVEKMDDQYFAANPGAPQGPEENKFFLACYELTELSSRSGKGNVTLPENSNTTDTTIRDLYKAYKAQDPAMEADRELFMLSHFNPSANPEELERILLTMNTIDAKKRMQRASNNTTASIGEKEIDILVTLKLLNREENRARTDLENKITAALTAAYNYQNALTAVYNDQTATVKTIKKS